MNGLNASLLAIIIFLLGGLCGLLLSPLGNSTPMSSGYIEDYNRVMVLKYNSQRMLLEFYMDHYCENSNFRLIDISYNGTLFQGGYCDKDTVMLLDDTIPPMPFLILGIEDDINEPP